MFNDVDNKVKILVVEDNKSIIEGLEYLLEKEGFEAQIVTTQKQAMAYVKGEGIDLFLLDIELPDGSGFDICKQIKDLSNKPIIFLSARTEESNIVYGLDMGADDYITKPFRNSELISRIKCVLRRYPKSYNCTDVINYKHLKIDLKQAKVYNNSKEIFLTNLEYKLLLMFVRNENKLVTREELLEKIWDVDGNYVNDNTLSVYIKRLRKKISNTSCKEEIIETIRGMGYILKK